MTKKLSSFVEDYNRDFGFYIRCEVKENCLDITADVVFTQVFIYRFINFHRENLFDFFFTTTGNEPTIHCFNLL